MLTAEPKAYGANWYAATVVDSPVRARLIAELDVDVCVIGAGLAGLTVAREVARHGWSVAVLETRSVAWSASGRNTGVVLPGFGLGADALIERAGLEQAKALWALSADGAEYVRKAASAMPRAELSEKGWLHVSRTDNEDALTHEAMLMIGEFGATIEPWSVENVREVLNSPRYFHALHYPRAFCVNPLNYAMGLAADAEAAGARIFEDTPVLEIDPAGVRKRIVTRDSRVRAAHVVLACNVHLTGLVTELASTLLPIFSTSIVTAPLGDKLHEAIRYAGAVSDTEFAFRRYRVIDGDRLMWSGYDAVRPGKPQRQAKALLRQIRRTFPALRNVKVESAWIGVTGHTVHGMPQIGEITPGLWLLSGFGSQGLKTSAMAGEIISRAIIEGDRTWEQFSPFALVWAGGAFGRAAQRISEWSRGSRQMLNGLLARGREAKRVRTAKRLRKKAAKAAKAAAARAAIPQPLPAPVPEPVVVERKPAAVIVPPAPRPMPVEPPVVVAPLVIVAPPVATPTPMEPIPEVVAEQPPEPPPALSPPEPEPLPAEPVAAMPQVEETTEPPPMAEAQPVPPEAPEVSPDAAAVAPMPDLGSPVDSGKRKSKRGKRRKNRGGMPPY